MQWSSPMLQSHDLHVPLRQTGVPCQLNVQCMSLHDRDRWPVIFQKITAWLSMEHREAGYIQPCHSAHCPVSSLSLAACHTPAYMTDPREQFQNHWPESFQTRHLDRMDINIRFLTKNKENLIIFWRWYNYAGSIFYHYFFFNKTRMFDTIFNSRHRMKWF